MTSVESQTSPPEDTAGYGSAAMAAAPAPVAAAGASRIAVLLGLVMIGTGALGVRDALVAVGWISGRQWLPLAIGAVDGLALATWMVPAGAALAVVGLTMMVIAVLPRRRTAVPLIAETPVYLARTDIAKIASAAALGIPGVLAARSTTTRRRAVVRCRVTGSEQQVRAEVADAVAAELSALRTAPRLIVRTRSEGRS